MCVLQVEGSREVAGRIAGLLGARGLRVEFAADDQEAVELAGLYDYDLILLDWAMNGLRLIRRLRAAKIDTPVMVLSVDGRVETKVSALTAGADDYAVRPIHNDELVARAKALIRRKRASPPEQVGNLAVDLDLRLVRVSGVPVSIVGREFEVLEQLWLNRGDVVGKWDLMDSLYGPKAESIADGAKIIDVWVHRLRRKLREAGLKGAEIQTVWGRGYVLREIQ